MVEPTFRALELLAQLAVAATGTKITYRGEQHIPERGGAVVAINHTSYVDFLPAGLAVYRRGRRLRFMIKAEMQQVRVVNFLIKHTRTIPVDRAPARAPTRWPCSGSVRVSWWACTPKRRSVAASSSRSSRRAPRGWRWRRTSRSSR